MKKRIFSVICILLLLGVFCVGIREIRTDGQQAEVSFLR